MGCCALGGLIVGRRLKVEQQSQRHGRIVAPRFSENLPERLLPRGKRGRRGTLGCVQGRDQQGDGVLAVRLHRAGAAALQIGENSIARTLVGDVGGVDPGATSPAVAVNPEVGGVMFKHGGAPLLGIHNTGIEGVAADDADQLDRCSHPLRVNAATDIVGSPVDT